MLREAGEEEGAREGEDGGGDREPKAKKLTQSLHAPEGLKNKGLALCLFPGPACPLVPLSDN